MATQVLLHGIDQPNVQSLAGYRAVGGYASVEKALKMAPADIVEEVKKSGLAGRGGAGFPTGLKWSLLDKTPGRTPYLVCNADESEPGTFKDRLLMWKLPHRLIEGLIVSSYALNSRNTYIYIRGELMWVADILERAIQEAHEAGLLGDDILGSGFSLNIHVHPGAGAYICGEESALLESLEGKRGNPRMKPPFVTTVGLYGEPTVVNNVETLSAVPWIIMNGGAAYAAMGTEKSKGTKLMCASGHINRPGVYEIELGLPVEEFIYSDQYCGGIRGGRQLKAVIPGGSSAPILPARLALKTPSGGPRLLSADSMSEGGLTEGSMLGSGGFIVMDETACIVRNTWNLARFYHHESCGQCSPCREGTGWMEKILYRLVHGDGYPEDVDVLYGVSKKIEGKTICAFGEAAAWPVGSAVRHFREEFEAKALQRAL